MPPPITIKSDRDIRLFKQFDQDKARQADYQQGLANHVQAADSREALSSFFRNGGIEKG
jgi:hypothetical protein